MTTSAVAQPKQNYNKNKPDFTSPLVNKKKMFYVSNELGRPFNTSQLDQG